MTIGLGHPECVFDGGFYTEGPAVGPDGKVYFCDITPTFLSNMRAGAIWAFDPMTGQTHLFRSPSGMASGIAFDALGRMIIATGADFGSRCIVRTDLSSGLSEIVAGLYNGQAFNAPNDLVVDRSGRIYFTDPRYFGHEPIEQPVFGVYRIDPDGSIHLVLADVSKPNGIALSPDETTLYVVEHDIRILDRRLKPIPMRDQGEMRILAYDLREGQPDGQRVVVDFGTEKGADGMTVDRAGNLYAAVQSRSRPGVRVYAGDGTMIGETSLPETPSNCVFVDHDTRPHLYVTAGRGLYRIMILKS